MIYRLFYFPRSGAARVLAPLPENFQRSELADGVCSTITGPAVIVVNAAVGELEQALALAQRHSALEIVAVSEGGEPPSLAPGQLYAWLTSALPTAVIAQALANAFVHAQLREEQERTRAHVARLSEEFQHLNTIGIGLSAERDTAVLLELIVTKAREITYADAGSLYLVEDTATGERRLRFTVVQNDSFPVPFEGYSLAINADSVAGWVALTGRVVNLEDAYTATSTAPFGFDRGYDRQVGYRTKSMLVVPLKTLDDRVIGVLQLINCKADRAWRFASLDEIVRQARAFPARYEDLACSLASQAAVALENSRLYTRLAAALDGLRVSQEGLIRAERLRALDDMAAGLAHDFNNSLAVILGRAQLLLNQTNDPELHRQLREIEDAATEGAHTIQRIQEFTRARRERPFRAVELNEIVEDVVAAARARWQDDADGHAPAAYDIRVEAGPVLPVAGDPRELRQALTHLVVNAIEAMPQGGHLTVRTFGDDERVCCGVTDTGLGMDEQVSLRIFEPFFTTKGTASSGLGLSATYGIVARHGGDVHVQSRPGLGSTFTIRLPAAREFARAPKSPSPARSR